MISDLKHPLIFMPGGFFKHGENLCEIDARGYQRLHIASEFWIDYWNHYAAHFKVLDENFEYLIF
ncbi:hypothetical protein ASF16_14945 [Acidovorax sp. Leaf78]|nr:hypothetical protein ASF16_14945 [Acidovorax sp. Leaf78]